LYLAKSDSSKVQLFCSDTQGKPLLPKEVEAWLCAIMKMAGIKADVSAHSLRSASVFKARDFMSSSVIMEAVDWKSDKIFHTIYLRNISSDSVIESRRQFQSAFVNS